MPQNDQNRQDAITTKSLERTNIRNGSLQQLEMDICAWSPNVAIYSINPQKHYLTTNA